MHNVADDIANEGRTLKSEPSVDSDDLQSIIKYVRSLPFVKPDKVGCVGVSHGGETILKAAAEMDFTCGVAIEGASHEFLTVDTGPNAPRIGSEVQYNDVNVARKNANKARAMERIRKINTPILHIGRDPDHLQGIFKLAHEWMVEAGKDSTWAQLQSPRARLSVYRTRCGWVLQPESRAAGSLRSVHELLRSAPEIGCLR